MDIEKFKKDLEERQFSEIKKMVDEELRKTGTLSKVVRELLLDDEEILTQIGNFVKKMQKYSKQTNEFALNIGKEVTNIIDCALYFEIMRMCAESNVAHLLEQMNDHQTMIYNGLRNELRDLQVTEKVDVSDIKKGKV